MFDLHYKKNRNDGLFKSLEKVGITKIQNYVPLYGTFFSLSDNNYNTINLNQHYSIQGVESHDNRNRFVCKLVSDNNTARAVSFFKFSPLLDPIKYLMGKYQTLSLERFTRLPSFGNSDGIEDKVCDANNSAYVDSFFSYLTSQLLHRHKFIHGLDFYGSFLSVKKDFIANVVDDLEYLHDSDYFHENKGTLFELMNWSEDMSFDFDTRHNKKKIRISDDLSETEAASVSDLDFGDVFSAAETKETVPDSSNNLIFEFDVMKTSSKKTASTCSSRSSNTDSENADGSGSEGSDCDDGENSSKSSESKNSGESLDSDLELQVSISEFPVQIICLECLDDTLDTLLSGENEMDDDEWKSCLFQIIMTLVAYQKMFDFTHNDLHTNNIMFNKTDKKFLLYKFEGRYYKVPTFGRIYKIIDFGRAIYKYKGKIICSDSFHPKGDAATQYNCEPYLNDKKPRLEPNASFDLCRLACSLFDYFIEKLEEQSKTDDPIAKTVVEWCTDDKGRNVLYKKNGDERYPDFKLYKMIARTVTKHIPSKQVGKPLFNKFISTRKKIGKKAKVMDMDALHDYTKA